MKTPAGTSHMCDLPEGVAAKCTAVLPVAGQIWQVSRRAAAKSRGHVPAQRRWSVVDAIHSCATFAARQEPLRTHPSTAPWSSQTARRRYIASPRDLWSGWPQCANQPEGGAEPLVSANEPTQLPLNGCEACGTANVPSIACYPCLHGEPLRGGTGGSKGDHGGVHEWTELIEQLWLAVMISWVHCFPLCKCRRCAPSPHAAQPKGGIHPVDLMDAIPQHPGSQLALRPGW